MGQTKSMSSISDSNKNIFMVPDGRETKMSVIIPYGKRLQNLHYVLKSLAKQSMPRNDFEIIIGCIGISVELSKLVSDEFMDLNIGIVMVNGPWNTSKARNIAIKESKGIYMVLLDADIIVPSNFLEHIWNNHQNVDRPCIMYGQMKTYDEWGETFNVALPPYSFYEDKYLVQEGVDYLPTDIRWKADLNIPWSFCWTAIVSIPRKEVFENSLYFDENFKGWGVEDIEWGYRVHKCGIKTHLPTGLWGVHLPHFRDAKKNHEDEADNYRKFISKWPALDVEVVARFGDYKGNGLYKAILKKINYIIPAPGYCFCTIKNTEEDSNDLYIGAILDNKNELVNGNSFKKPPRPQPHNTLPLLGIFLPYDSRSHNRVFLSKEIMNISDDLKKWIDFEAKRICQEIIY
jgi:glycosyltransferase involved in cell wall biosynthesis